MLGRLLLAGSLACMTVAPAFAGIDLDISPLRVEIQVLPGAEYTNAIELTNFAEEPVRMRAYLEDWTLDPVGTPVFMPVGASQASSAPWVTVGPEDFLIEGAQTEHVRFTVHVPEGVAEGAYHSAVLFETVPLNRADKPGRQVFMRGRVACMLYVTVGEPERQAEIRSLAAVVRGEQPRLRFEVENTGGAFIRLAGDVRLAGKDAGAVASLPLPDVPVLPGMRRIVEIDMPRKPFLEAANAILTIDLADAGILVGECPLSREQAKLGAKR